MNSKERIMTDPSKQSVLLLFWNAKLRSFSSLHTMCGLFVVVFIVIEMMWKDLKSSHTCKH